MLITLAKLKIMTLCAIGKTPLLSSLPSTQMGCNTIKQLQFATYVVCRENDVVCREDNLICREYDFCMISLLDEDWVQASWAPLASTPFSCWKDLFPVERIFFLCRKDIELDCPGVCWQNFVPPWRNDDYSSSYGTRTSGSSSSPCFR